MNTWIIRAHGATAVIFLLASASIGCGTSDVALRDDVNAAGAGAGGAGGGATGTGGGEGCQGQCAPLGPLEWLGPALLWIGKEGEAPECPPSAPVQGSPMFGDLNASNLCGACKCDAPSGSCSLPTKLTAYNSMSCLAPPGAVLTSFDAPAGWDGSCTAANPIPAKLMCNGGNCVQSLTIAPLTLTQEPCGVSMEPIAARLPATWGTVARSCQGTAYGSCETPAEVCAPAVEAGFAQCIVRDGDRECPAPHYTVKHVFYGGLVDTRDCTTCTCSAPVGSTCTALVSIFKDVACLSSSLVVADTIDATGPACLDILPSGQALLSKLATAAVYAPGACQVSGGESIGEAAPAEPSTFCCLPPGM